MKPIAKTVYQGSNSLASKFIDQRKERTTISLRRQSISWTPNETNCFHFLFVCVCFKLDVN